MRINRLETHDRLLQFKGQSEEISQGCQQCIDKRPPEFGDFPFYIFAHKRELGMDERFALLVESNSLDFSNIPTHRLIWIPRLKKPLAQTNSMLFKYFPLKDLIEVIWIIPEPETWDQFTKGKMIENSIVCESIHKFKTDKSKLEDDDPDDMSDELAKHIYNSIAKNAQKKVIK